MTEPMRTLGARDKKILQLIIDGKTTVDISRELNLSMDKVRFYLRRIAQLLDPGPVELVSMAPQRRITLTETQVKVLTAVANGQHTKQIAKDMRLNEDSVKAHLRRINAELGTSTRTDAAVKALRLGLIP